MPSRHLYPPSKHSFKLWADAQQIAEAIEIEKKVKKSEATKMDWFAINLNNLVPFL